MIVHGRAASSNVQAVMWVVGELGLSHERRDVGGRFGGNDAPAFRAISPHGLVPALEDGEVAFESFGGHGSFEDRGAPRDFEEIEAVVPGAPIADETPLAASIAARPPVAPSGALDITT